MHKLDKEVEDILQHWGVKGMKWDKKKKKEDEEDEEENSEISEEDQKLVNDVIRGNYGNGEERKRKLGERYREIQDMVNEQLRSGSPIKGASKKKRTPSYQHATVTSAKKKGTPSYQHATVTSAKKKGTPSYQHATVKSAKKKLKPKNKARSKSYLQSLKSKTTKELRKLFSKFVN